MATTDLTSTLDPRPDTAIERLRKGIPVWLLPVIITLRFWIAWCIPSVRKDARKQMRFLLEKSRPEADIDAAAKKYVRRMIRRGEERWHPELVTHLRVEDLDRFQAAREQGKGLVLSFMHLAEYDGGAPSIARLGFTGHYVVHPNMLQTDTPGWQRQHLKIVSSQGNHLVSATVGTKGMLELLQQGHVVAIAADVPGRTPISFCGRTVLGPSGAARLAMATGAPVVIMTFEVDERGPFIQANVPLQPTDFGSHEELLSAIIAVHERAVLAQPEAVDIPLSRWAFPETASPGASPGDGT